MAWISVHEQVVGGKLRTLAKELNCSQNEALGMLVTLWLWGINNADSEGKIIGATRADIAKVLYVGLNEEIDPLKAVDALITTGWIDLDTDLYLHDWGEWQEQWYKAMTSVVMTSFIKILKEVGTFDDDNGKIEKMNQSKLLIIDDLGAERGTDYSLERVYDIIDSRYRSNKPIILTTNLTMEQMKNCEDIRYNRIYDRIFEMCYPVKVSGLSWRKREAASRYAATKQILEG